MAILSATPAQQLEVRRRAAQASRACQVFSQNAAVLTAAQSAIVDTAIANLHTALSAAGAGAALLGTQKLLTSTVKTPVGTVSGSGTFGTPTIVAGVITGIVLSAS